MNATGITVESNGETFELLAYRDDRGEIRTAIASTATYPLEVAPERYTGGPKIGQVVPGDNWVVGYRYRGELQVECKGGYTRAEALERLAQLERGGYVARHRAGVRWWRDADGTPHAHAERGFDERLDFSADDQARIVAFREAAMQSAAAPVAAVPDASEGRRKNLARYGLTEDGGLDAASLCEAEGTPLSTPAHHEVECLECGATYPAEKAHLVDTGGMGCYRCNH